MIMSDDKKKASTLIVSGLGPMKPAPMSEDGAEMDDSMAMEAAGEEILAAIASKSPKALMEAFKAAFELCEYSEDEEAEGQE